MQIDPFQLDGYDFSKVEDVSRFDSTELENKLWKATRRWSLGERIHERNK